MSVPQTKDRPASALRAVFASIGSLLSVKDKLSGKDKVRAKPAAEAPAGDAVPVAEAVAPETTAEAVAAEPETAVKTIAEPEPAPEPAAEAEKAAEPEAVVAEPTAPAEPAAAPAATTELPLENYDELTVASLRARLRNLSNEDLAQLKEYEAAHQNRPEVIKMFQNRLIKMTGSMPKLEA